MATARDLIDGLSRLEDLDVEIVLEGCDCAGPWDGTIDTNLYGNSVMLNRGY